MMDNEIKEPVPIPTLEQVEAERDHYRTKNRKRQIVRSTIAVLIVAAAIAVLVATLWMPVLQVYGSSMSPTLENEQIVVSLKGGNYRRGDLVAFYYGNKLLIKRVIGCPGDWIDIKKNGDVYLNGELLEEPYASNKAFGDCDQEFPVQMTEDRWFLMGDNREVSLDSRSTTMGLISGEQIVGRIVLRVWPLNKFGPVE